MYINYICCSVTRQPLGNLLELLLINTNSTAEHVVDCGPPSFCIIINDARSHPNLNHTMTLA